MISLVSKLPSQTLGLKDLLSTSGMDKNLEVSKGSVYHSPASGDRNMESLTLTGVKRAQGCQDLMRIVS